MARPLAACIAAAGLLAAGLLSAGAGVASAATWEKTLMPDGRTGAFLHVRAMADGGVVAVGLAAEIANVPSAQDALIVRLDANGAPAWERTYGRPGDNEQFVGVVELAGGDLVVAGTTGSFGPDGQNPWLLRLDGATGDIVWQEHLEGDPIDARGMSLDLLPDGSLVYSATCVLPPDNHLNGLIVALDGSGAPLWQKAFADLFNPIVSATADGGIIVTGNMWTGQGAWVARLDAAGAIDWQVNLNAVGGVGQVAGLATFGNETALSMQAVAGGDSVPAFARLDATGALTWQGRLDNRGYLGGIVLTAAGIAATGAIGLPADGLYPSFVQIDPSGALTTQEWFDPRTGNLNAIAATSAGFVVVGDSFVEDARESGGWTLGLDPGGGLDASCPIAHPHVLLLADPQFTSSAASNSTTDVAINAVASNAVPGVVASHATLTCSAIECSTPHVSITSIEPLPACAGSTLTFAGVGSGNAPLTFEWDFDYTGTFVADAAGATASHAFLAPGTSTVALRVTDSCVATGPRQALATIDVPIHDCPPAGDPTWMLTLGADGFDEPQTAFETADGGFIIAGGTSSPGRGREGWIVKVDAAGHVAWTNCLGGGDYQEGVAARALPSGDILFMGGRQNFTDGSTVPWAAILSESTGQLLSERVYGDSTDQSFPSGLALAGGGGFAWSAMSSQARWIVSMTDADTIAWQDRVDDPDAWMGDVNAVAVGPGGDVIAVGSSANASWLMLHDGAGALLWQETLTGDVGTSITRDVVSLASDHVVVGSTTDVDGDLDGWLVRLAADGSVLWQNAIGGTGAEELTRLHVLPDGGFIAVGWTTSWGRGGRDAWIVRFDAAGAIVWERAHGGTDYDQAVDVVPTADGGFLLVGQTASFGAGITDAWLLRLDGAGLIGGSCDLTTDTTSTITPLLSAPVPTALANAPGARVVATDAGLSAQCPGAVTQRCGTSLPPIPLQPDLLDITMDGADLLLHFTLVANGETYNFYEFDGVIVGLRPPVQSYCHETAANPAFLDLGDGTATFRLRPSRDLTSYIVSASNWLGESALSDGAGGELDNPPSFWRCGANP